MTLRIRTSKEYLKRIPHALGEHAFLFTLVLIGLAGGISALVFFFAILHKTAGETGAQKSVIELRRDVFDSVLTERVLQDQRARDSTTSFPKDMFRLGK